MMCWTHDSIIVIWVVQRPQSLFFPHNFPLAKRFGETCVRNVLNCKCLLWQTRASCAGFCLLHSVCVFFSLRIKDRISSPDSKTQHRYVTHSFAKGVWKMISVALFERVVTSMPSSQYCEKRHIIGTPATLCEIELYSPPVMSFHRVLSANVDFIMLLRTCKHRSNLSSKVTSWKIHWQKIAPIFAWLLQKLFN